MKELKLLAAFAAVGIMAAATVGCRSVRPVTVTETKYVTDTVTQERIVYVKEDSRSSEHVRESSTEKTTVTVNDRGDTLRTDKETVYIRDAELERENLRLMAMVDSLRLSHTDAAYKEVPVEVERAFTWWERFRLSAFWWLVGIVASLAAYAFRTPLLMLIRKII